MTIKITFLYSEQNVYKTKCNRFYDQIWKNEEIESQNEEHEFDERPDCEQILEDKILWLLSAQEFNPKNELERVLN